ncbi:P2-like prophage tail protein X [Acinetobacter marinus]|uniref:P2-like prophage tail protein X n=1 Tax=Acinetobacter marinus TaxID=281375 RepID=A0A1G6JE12_9GAMM|nr:tail protein X [Acinetobacter marinus]SDC17062.1 P2-like prophage tail protein X [Acinetobacter marinus]
MAEYRTKDGDTVSYIAYQYYGHTDNRVVEKVLEANRFLADHGAILPAGLLITLPEQTTTAKSTSKRVKLWD